MLLCNSVGRCVEPYSGAILCECLGYCHIIDRAILNAVNLPCARLCQMDIALFGVPITTLACEHILNEILKSWYLD